MHVRRSTRAIHHDTLTARKAAAHDRAVTSAAADAATNAATQRALASLRRVVVPLLCAFALVSGLVTVGAGRASAASGTGTVLSAVNAARANAGRSALSLSGDLTSVAQRWSRTLADSGELRHNPNLAGAVDGWSVLGENVGYGGTPSVVQDAFMASPHHRDNILDSRFSQIGIGITVDDRGVAWVVQVFRKPVRSSSVSDAPAKKATSKSTPKPTKKHTKKPTPKHSTRPHRPATPTPSSTPSATPTLRGAHGLPRHRAAVPQPRATATRSVTDTDAGVTPDQSLARGLSAARATRSAARTPGGDPVGSALAWADAMQSFAG